jgi:hypothetical protein
VCAMSKKKIYFQCISVFNVSTLLKNVSGFCAHVFHTFIGVCVFSRGKYEYVVFSDAVNGPSYGSSRIKSTSHTSAHTKYKRRTIYRCIETYIR